MSFQLKSKIWLEKENKKVFGDGPLDILKRVERTGSIRQASAEINMSYSQAWRLIKMVEQNLGFPILRKKTGGAGGGYSSLTEEASALIAAYDAFRHEANRSLERLFQKHLSPVTDRHN
ncbi:MAG: winged helix-turn-helix domain-containing protein [Bacillota bacterium]